MIKYPILCTGGPQFSLVFTTDKRTGIHNRIIWACSWSPDSLYFGTGSREGTVVVWGKDQQGQCSAQGAPLALAKSVTALAFAPSTQPYLLAVGSEDGLIALYEWQPQGDEGWSLRAQLDKQYPSLAT